MPRTLSSAWPSWVWFCSSCDLILPPKAGPDGKLRLPRPDEMREAGWWIGERVVLDLCPMCARLT